MLDWKSRDRAIIEQATRHVCVTRHFFRHFTSETAAYRRAEKLREQDLLRVVGTVIVGDSGRPENVYCNGWKPKRDQLIHEILLTDFLDCYPDADVLRGWAVNRRLRPDAEMSLGGIFFNVELDTGEQSYAQVRRRQRKFAGSKDFLLYVTQSSRRLEGLRTHADRSVQSIVLFTTLGDAQKNPAGDIVIDAFGERAPIVAMPDAAQPATVEETVQKPVENPQ